MYLLRIASLFLFAILPVVGAMAEQWRATEEEMRLLPPYCEAKIGADRDNMAAQKHWSDVFGAENWLHLHHYCDGLNFMNRSFKRGSDRNARDFDLRRAVNNFDYVLTRASNDFVLLPEIMAQKARALHMLGRKAEAASLDAKVIAMQPDYIPAYIALGDFYKESGDLKKARETYEAGLIQHPGQRSLVRRLKRLERDEARHTTSSR